MVYLLLLPSKLLLVCCWCVVGVLLFFVVVFIMHRLGSWESVPNTDTPISSILICFSNVKLERWLGEFLQAAQSLEGDFWIVGARL